MNVVYSICSVCHHQSWSHDICHMCTGTAVWSAVIVVGSTGQRSEASDGCARHGRTVHLWHWSTTTSLQWKVHFTCCCVLQPFSVYFCRLLLHNMTARHASMYIVTISYKIYAYTTYHMTQCQHDICRHCMSVYLSVTSRYCIETTGGLELVVGVKASFLLSHTVL